MVTMSDNWKNGAVSFVVFREYMEGKEEESFLVQRSQPV